MWLSTRKGERLRSLDGCDLACQQGKREKGVKGELLATVRTILICGNHRNRCRRGCSKKIKESSESPRKEPKAIIKTGVRGTWREQESDKGY